MHYPFFKKIKIATIVFFLIPGISLFAQNITGSKEFYSDPKIGVIYDADFASDPQDVGAVAMLFSLSNLQQVKILGIMCGTNNSFSALAVSSLIQYYNHPEIPIGVLKKGSFSGDSEFKSGYTYNTFLAKNYPHSLKSLGVAENATAVLRKILTRSENKSIHYICTGNLINLQNLLNSKPDAISPLFGFQLVKKKISLLTLTIGGFPKCTEEYHLLSSLESSQNISSTWPSPILYIGRELENICQTGPQLMKSTKSSNPVRAAYLLWDKNNYKLLDPLYKGNYIHPHTSYAQLAVYFSILGEYPKFELSPSGAAFIDCRGMDSWVLNYGRSDHYLIAKNDSRKLAGQFENWMAFSPKR